MTLINPRSAVLALSLTLVSVSALAQDLTINAGETYTNNDTLNNDDTLTNAGTLNNYDTLNNDGTLENDYGTLNNAGTLTNNGTLNNNDYGTLNNNLGGTLTNQVGGTLTSTGTLLNNNFGTVFVIGGTVDATTIDNNGTFNLTGGTVDATTIWNEDGTFNFSGGTLNVDTFNGHLNNTGGTLGPGHSPGTTTINGDYSKDEFSTLLIEIAGTMAGSEYDVLNVTGDASLNDGVLRLDLLDGFEPVIGDAFVILQSANIIGAFGGIYSTTALGEGLRWDLDYSNIGGNDFLTVRVSAGPIPAATTVPVPLPLWLFVVLSALIGGLGYRRLYIA